MSLPGTIWYCEEHRSPTGDRHIDGASRCFLALDEGLIIRDCRFIELRVAGRDDLSNACPWDQYGHHHWLPWLQITDRSWVTRCLACGRVEQWDV